MELARGTVGKKDILSQWSVETREANGVDNRTRRGHPWIAGLLNIVSGLGPYRIGGFDGAFDCLEAAKRWDFLSQTSGDVGVREGAAD
jgi:hypothetical protein